MIPPGSVEMGPPSPRGPVFVRPRASTWPTRLPPEEPPAGRGRRRPATPERPRGERGTDARGARRRRRRGGAGRRRARAAAAAEPAPAGRRRRAAAPQAAPAARLAPVRAARAGRAGQNRRHRRLRGRRGRGTRRSAHDAAEERLSRLLRPAAADDRGAGTVLDFRAAPPRLPALRRGRVLPRARHAVSSTVFAHAYAHSSREHLYSNVVSMLLVGGVLEAVEGPLCVLCIFACAGALRSRVSLILEAARLRAGRERRRLRRDGRARFYDVDELARDAVPRYFRLLACVLVIAAEVAGRYWYRQPNLGYAAHFGGAVGGAAAALVLVRNVRLVRSGVCEPSTCAPTPSTRRGAHRPIPAQDATSSRSWSPASWCTRSRRSPSSTTPVTRGRRSAWRWSRRRW